MPTIAPTAPAGQVTFKGTSRFLPTLRERVEAKLAGRPRRDDPRIYRKAAIVLAWFAASYLLALNTSGWVQVLACFAHALAACAVGFNVFHDSVHESFSANAKRNLFIARLTSLMLGASRKYWWFKHNVLHHRFTNIYRHDDDLETRDSFRLSPRQEWKPKFRYQHLYFPFLYALTTIEWMFVKEYVQYATGRMNPFQPVPTLSTSEKWEFFGSKAGYYLFTVVIPLMVLPWWKVLLGLVMFHLTLGLSLALIFNLAHAMEMSEFPEPDPETQEVEDEWAAHQMRTTVNFATGSRGLSWFAGGLNFQIEHHLFPQISHTHYPDIAPIVRKTAAEFGLPYNEYPTYLSALTSHYRILKKLAKP